MKSGAKEEALRQDLEDRDEEDFQKDDGKEAGHREEIRGAEAQETADHHSTKEEEELGVHATPVAPR